MEPIFGQRQIRICYWNQEPRYVNAARLKVERLLESLGKVALFDVANLEDPQLFPCDLLVVNAQHVDEIDFLKWLNGLQAKMISQGQIWIPALIFADIKLATIQNIWSSVFISNWYFDILSPDHIDSLPLRVANLLRIHDHIHELRRYDDQLSDLQSKYDRLLKQTQELIDTNRP